MKRVLVIVKEKIIDLTKSKKNVPKTINLCRIENSCSSNLEQYFLALYTIVYGSMRMK